MTRRLTKKLNESRPALFTDGAPTIPVTVIGTACPSCQPTSPPLISSIRCAVSSP